MWPLGKLGKTSRMWEEYDHIPSSASGVCVCVCVCVCVFSWVCKHIGEKARIESSDVIHKDRPKCKVYKSFSLIVSLH